MDGTRLTVFGQGESVGHIFEIGSEDDAWKLLENLQDDSFAAPSTLVLGDWCHVKLYLKGKQWNSSITPSIFPVFNQLQELVYSTYAEIQYGGKKRKLTKEEKEALEIVITISGGSANQQQDFRTSLCELGRALANKMTGRQIVFVLTVIALSVAGTVVHRDYAQNKRDIRLAEVGAKDKKTMLEGMQFMSMEETKRMELLVKSTAQSELLEKIQKNIENLHESMLKAATQAEESNISGVRLKKAEANELIKAKREKPSPLQIYGVFQILSIDWKGVPHQVLLKRIDDGFVIRANFELPWLPEDSRKIMQRAEWKENGEKAFEAKINARETKGKIVNADLVRVDAIKETTDDDTERSP